VTARMSIELPKVWWSRIRESVRSDRAVSLLVVYAVAIASAQVVGLFVGAVAGGLLDAALVIAILLATLLIPGERYRELLPITALVALMPLATVAAVLPDTPRLVWYATTGGPLLVGGVLAARLLDDPVKRLRLGPRLGVDRLAAPPGIAAGLLGYLVLRPEPLLSGHPSAMELLAATTTLVTCASFMEEMLLRGLLLASCEKLLASPTLALALMSAVTAALYVGSGSIGFALLMGAMAAFWGACLRRGASIWGVTAGHAFMLLCMAGLAAL
jgi:membrane protease YdiL (CAAX protease family)